jgi:LmbE family N-acetylglucosaminyl deacetylase
MLINPNEYFEGTILVAVPHMDDEALACGGTIARLPQKDRIYVVYATDGMKSPAPLLPWSDKISPDLGAVRMGESRAAMEYLGIPKENITFLSLPEAQLGRNLQALNRSFKELIKRLRPSHILLPFRYDRHPDHLALNHVITDIYRQGSSAADLSEYFVYYRWRLLPTGDVRNYLHPSYLFEVDIRSVSDQKRAALECFKSQTTNFYPWQTRPILTPALIDEVSNTPEFFLQYEPSLQGAKVFTRTVPWIRVVHRLEPFLKKIKDQIIASWARVHNKYVRQRP